MMEVASFSRPKVWQPWLCDYEPRATVGKEVPSARWRRERRACPLTANRPHGSRQEAARSAADLPASSHHEMAPLDMSTRRKPSNDIQVVSSKPSPRVAANQGAGLRGSTNQRAGQRSAANERAAQRASVITCTNPSQSSGSSGDEEDAVLGLGEDFPKLRDVQESDPVIDEHFRRSLGRDYLALFPTPRQPATPSLDARRPSAEKERAKPPQPSSVTLTGLSVDDHFAKALGETWLRLQAGEKATEGGDKAKTTSPTPTEPSPQDPSRKAAHKSPSGTAAVLHAPLKVST